MAFNDDFQKLLASSRHSLLAKVKDGVVNSKEFRRLLAMLQTFSTNSGVDLFAIVIDEADLKNLNFDDIQSNLSNKILLELQLRNHFIVDNSFCIVSSDRTTFSSSSEARNIYKQISLERKCVILTGKFVPFPHYFFNGEDVGEATFFSEADFNKFRQLRDISEIVDVIDEFREHICQYYVYAGFFVPKSTLRAIYGVDKSNYRGRANILRNKPEDILRQCLKNFLTDRINRSFNFFRETQMDNTARRLDIIAEDDKGYIYFIEVKWIGESIGPEDNRITTIYDENRILEGIEQTLQYIAEWQTNKRTVSLGCLVVFDARNNKINYEHTTYKEKLQSHTDRYSSNVPRFRKLPDLCIDNVSPT